MLSLLRSFLKNLPTLVLAFALALAVWISAVTAADPTFQRPYARQVAVEIVGQDPGLVLTSNREVTTTVTLSAPQSIWDTALNSENNPVRAVVDLSGLGPGEHSAPIQIQVNVRLVQIVSHSPAAMNVTLEPLSTRSFPIQLIRRGEPAIGFVAGNPTLNQEEATVSGAASRVERVQEIRAVLDLSQARENVNRDLSLEAVDANDAPVSGVTVNPEKVIASTTINNRGGYRNVVVKVATTGQIASGYRLTNVSVFPPAVTVFSMNPEIVNELPGYVETASLDLTGAKDDLDVRLPLELPPGVSIVGDQTVSVQVGIAAIESSITLSAMQVEVTGLGPDQEAEISPETIDVIVSGPLPLLDSINKSQVRVIIEMNGEGPGTYQRVPRVELKIPELRVESILPGTVEITLTQSARPSPSPTP